MIVLYLKEMVCRVFSTKYAFILQFGSSLSSDSVSDTHYIGWFDNNPSSEVLLTLPVP